VRGPVGVCKCKAIRRECVRVGLWVCKCKAIRRECVRDVSHELSKAACQ